jgi:hypothetical protein
LVLASSASAWAFGGRPDGRRPQVRGRAGAPRRPGRAARAAPSARRCARAAATATPATARPRARHTSSCAPPGPGSPSCARRATTWPRPSAGVCRSRARCSTPRATSSRTACARAPTSGSSPSRAPGSRSRASTGPDPCDVDVLKRELRAGRLLG